MQKYNRQRIENIIYEVLSSSVWILIFSLLLLHHTLRIFCEENYDESEFLEEVEVCERNLHSVTILVYFYLATIVYFQSFTVII